MNLKLTGLEKQIDNIVLPEDIEKVALKSKIGDSGGNGDYSTYRVVFQVLLIQYLLVRKDILKLLLQQLLI